MCNISLKKGVISPNSARTSTILPRAHHNRAWFIYSLIAVIAICCLGQSSLSKASNNKYLSAWSAPSAILSVTPLSNASVRMIVRPGASGKSVRVKIENTLSSAPLLLQSATIAVRSSGAGIQSQTLSPLTFKGKPSVTIPAFGGVWTDDLKYKVDAGKELAISLYLPQNAINPTAHETPLVTGYLANGGGNLTKEITGASFTPTSLTLFVTALDVINSKTKNTIVAYGDSIAEGYGADNDAYNRWIDVLQNRLAQLPNNLQKVVINEGISGNTVSNYTNRPLARSPTALDRVNRDLLSRQGITDVIISIGVNDFTAGVSVDNILASIDQLIKRIKEHNLKVHFIPYLGRSYFTPALFQNIQTMNNWLRNNPMIDSVIDYPAEVLDPNNSLLLNSTYSADGTHLNAAGQALLANNINLAIFNSSNQPNEASLPVNFEFGWMGDTGYSSQSISNFTNLLAKLNNDEAHLKFVVHVGDTHGTEVAIPDFTNTLALFNSVNFPLIFTPGDNDWADMLDPTGSLSRVRQVFFNSANNNTALGVTQGQVSLEPSNKVFRQNDNSGLIENQKWVVNNVMFLTTHIVGSNDNCVQDNLDGSHTGTTDNVPASCSAEFRNRQAADIKWIKAAFKEARNKNLLGIGLFSQLMPLDMPINADGSCINPNDTSCKIYEPYMKTLVTEVRNLGKPVAVMYGDRHTYTIFNPIVDLPNFVAVITMGEPDTGWTRVRVDETNPQLFSFSVGNCIQKAGSINCPTISGARPQNVIAFSNVFIPNNDSCGTANNRTCESLVGDVVTDSARAEIGTQFVIHNSGGIRNYLTCPLADISTDLCPSNIYDLQSAPPFAITDGQVSLVLPFVSNLAVTFSMSGVELKSWLENSVSTMPAPTGRYPQISGLCFQYDITQPAFSTINPGNRVIPSTVRRQAADGSCTGALIDLTGTDITQYSVLSIDFMANGGDGYPAIPAYRQQILGKTFIDITVDGLKRSGSVSPKISGRSLCVDSNGALAPNCPIPLPACVGNAQPPTCNPY